MAIRLNGRDPDERQRAIGAAAAAARRGDLLLMPTDSVYALATDAFSARGIARLRAAKDLAPYEAIPVLVASPTTVSGIGAGITASARDLMTACWPGPLTLLVDPQPTLAWDLPADAALAVRMPLHPMALEVLRAVGPMAALAANRPGEPPTGRIEDARAPREDEVALVLDCGDLPESPLSTVVDVRLDPPVVVREGAFDAEVLRGVCPGLVA